MKTAKPPATENGGGGSSSRRAQPVRQTRINPPRNSSLNRGNSFTDTPTQERPIDIFPGVSNFTDAISALPKEIVRHFTLLKEVDAKIFHNEGKLFTNLRSALDTPPPAGLFPSFGDASTSTAPTSAPMSAQGSSTGAPPNLAPLSVPSNADSTNSAISPANLPRRQLFRETAYRLQEMMQALEEKNHVLLTANDALEKQMNRIDTVWPHLESEFSDEAKWGSTTHWAYVENRQAQQQAKTNDKQAERTRREGAATLSAAAEKLAEELAARSSDRKQAIAAKKNAKTQSGEGDGDKAAEPTKKAQTKSRKAPAEPAAPVGLGITTGATAAPAPSKRRKVETAKTNGGASAERAMSTVFGSSTAKPKTTSPRETPVPENGPKKRKALPTSSGQAKKSRINAAMSPSVASSPVVGTFPDTAKGSRASPVPLPVAVAPPRPPSSRARQNSTQSSTEGTRQRRPSAASNKPNGVYPDTPDLSQQSNGTKAPAEPKVHKETPIPAPTIAEPIKIETEIPSPVLEAPLSNVNHKKEATAKAAAATAAAEAAAGKAEAEAKVAEETEMTVEKEAMPPAAEPSPAPAATIAEERSEPPPKKESAPPAIQPPPPAANVVKTKSGRASKPSTPSLATFAEAASAASGTTTRSRPTRNNSDAATVQAANNTSTTTTTTTITTTASKRSHKKGASISASAATIAAQQAAAAAAAAAQAAAAKENATSGVKNTQKAEEEDDDEEDDEANEEEPRYCRCNGISYGEMVACDGANCQKEWFHLECVGLKVAPKGNAKWYCDECKERLKKR